MRLLTRLAATCLAVAATLSWVHADPPTQESVPVTIERISDRVAVARCPVGSNVTAIHTDQGVVIVDTNMSPGLMRAIRSKLENVFDASRFPYVVNTHGHWDHCSGNQVFPGATIIGHASTPLFMRNHQATGTLDRHERTLSRDREELESTGDEERALELRAKIRTREQIVSDLGTTYVSTPPSATFQDRRDLNLGDVTVELIYCGAAHTITDIFVYVPEERVVMTGDVFCSSISFCFVVSPLIEASAVLAAVDHVLARGVDVVIPGHGAVMSGEELRGLRDRLAGELAGQSGVTSAARTLEQAIERDGVDAARDRFTAAASDARALGYLSEEEFYLLGNRFVDKSRLDAAATTFELAAGFLPESSLVFGGLGRVHLLHGDTLSAISAYERACDLSPHNRGAETMLRRLRGR